MVAAKLRGEFNIPTFNCIMILSEVHPGAAKSLCIYTESLFG